MIECYLHFTACCGNLELNGPLMLSNEKKGLKLLPTQKSIAFSSDYFLLYYQRCSFIFHKHGIMLLRNQAFVENNNQCFEKMEDYFLPEIEDTCIVYERVSLFLTT